MSTILGRGVAAVTPAWVILGFILAGCTPSVPLTKLTVGDRGRIALQSLTLPEAHFLTLSKEGRPAVVWGELELPRSGASRVPAVILVHGCGGVGGAVRGWAGELNRAGYATFVLDSFGGRGIKETCTGQERINRGSRLIDAYRALELLATHPRVDPARIALMGFSQGGGVVLLARHRRFQRFWSLGTRDFAAYLALYPGACNRRLLDEEQVSDRPLRVFHGAADDWTPIGPCREYVERMRRAGKNAELLEYPDSHHGFDNPGLPPTRFRPQVQNSSNCIYAEQPNGRFAVFHRGTGAPVIPDAPCSSRGATIGYNARAHRQAIQDVRGFLESLLVTEGVQK